MRQPLALLLATAVALAGCGRAAAPTATLSTAPALQAPAAASAVTPAVTVAPGVPALAANATTGTAANAALVSNDAASLVSNDAAPLVGNNGAALNPDAAEPVPAPAGLDMNRVFTDLAYTASHAGEIVKASSLEDAELTAQEAASNPPSYRVDERTPYGVVVVKRSAHTATIAWRTDVPTKGVVDYGYAWGFDKKGFTEAFKDDVAKTDHEITLTNLSRFRAYNFKVTAVTPLGLRFSEGKTRSFRTKFWAWR
jgi:hypothetical protein